MVSYKALNTTISSIEKYDKFDDVVWTKKIKTIISKSYSTIVVETKGQKLQNMSI